MSEEELDVSEFLKKIVWSLSAILVWMMINILFGINWGYALFEKGHIPGSILFYSWIIISLFFLYKLYQKFWGKKNGQTEDGQTR
jgi:ABC-type long-subunit fatty acid transport system fused permease/ATPase subunit